YGETEEAFATRLADELEALILCGDPGAVAAFIAEPVMGGGGVVGPPRNYFEENGGVRIKYGEFHIGHGCVVRFRTAGKARGSARRRSGSGRTAYRSPRHCPRDMRRSPRYWCPSACTRRC